MWSYPNLIPLTAAKVQRMAEILEPFAFDAVYGAFSGRGQIDECRNRASKKNGTLAHSATSSSAKKQTEGTNAYDNPDSGTR